MSTLAIEIEKKLRFGTVRTSTSAIFFFKKYVSCSCLLFLTCSHDFRKHIVGVTGIALPES